MSRLHAVPVTADARDPMGRAPLHNAALDRPVEEVAALLAAERMSRRRTSRALRRSTSPASETAWTSPKVLLDAGAPVDPRDQWGSTPLWRAVFNANGDPRVVRRLVLAGADPDKANAAGQTPRDQVEMIANYDTSGYFDGAESS